MGWHRKLSRAALSTVMLIATGIGIYPQDAGKIQPMTHSDLVAHVLQLAIRAAGSQSELARLLKLPDRRNLNNWIRRSMIPRKYVPAIALVANWKTAELYPPEPLTPLKLDNLRLAVKRRATRRSQASQSRRNTT